MHIYNAYTNICTCVACIYIWKRKKNYNAYTNICTCVVYTFEKEKKIAMHIQTFVHVLYIHLKNKKKIMGSWCWKTSQMAEFQTQPKCQPNLATHHWGMGLGRGWDLQPVPQPHINPGPNPQGLSYPWQSLPTTMTHRSMLPTPPMMRHRSTLPVPAVTTHRPMLPTPVLMMGRLMLPTGG